MNYLKVFFISFLIFALFYGNIGLKSVSADDDENDFYEHHEEGLEGNENELYEEIGELIGWGTAASLCVAGALFPMRRLTKIIANNFKGHKKPYLFFARLLGKYHILIGITALILSIVHGIVMYLSEGELESEGIIGLGAVLFLFMASAAGLILHKNKKTKSIRATHITLIAITLFTAVFHIFVS